MDRQTLDYYEREAKPYAQAMAQGSARSLSAALLAGFLPRLRPGAEVLELGCGGGRDTLQMIEAGFAVDATDGSAAMAREAEALLGQAVRVMRFDQLEAVAAYDAVWAHASLHHLPFAELPDALARIARALRPGGWFFANYKLGCGDGAMIWGGFTASPHAPTCSRYTRRARGNSQCWRITALAGTTKWNAIGSRSRRASRLRNSGQMPPLSLGTKSTTTGCPRSCSKPRSSAATIISISTCYLPMCGPRGWPQAGVSAPRAW